MNRSVIKDKVLFRILLISLISFTVSFVIRVLAVKGFIPWHIGYSEVGCYFYEVNHKIPYFTCDFGYPVIIGILVYLTSRFSLDLYLFLNYVVFLICLIVSTYYLYRLSKLINSPVKYLYIFWACSLSFFLFVFQNWDIIAVMFSLMGLYYYKERKDIIATIFISLGFVTKVYPVLFILPILLDRKFIDWIKIGLIFVSVYFFTNIFFILRAFQGWYYFYIENRLRAPNIDSLWGLIYRLFPDYSINSINLTTLLLLVVSYLTVCLVFRKKDFLILSFCGVILFVLFNKVFSAQYVFWLLPFLALYGSNLFLFYLLEIANTVVFFSILTYSIKSNTITVLAIMDSFVYVREIAIIGILVLLLINISDKNYLEIKTKR